MKYVVIFKAQILNFDASYDQTAQALREKALKHFNCRHFEALSENGQEIALSYWDSLADIRAWHQDAEHQAAQLLGKEKWYKNFSVDICEITKQYASCSATAH
ncbi:antibiotic biosynthesis monooxygenase [Acinetobacter cumulans]|uniref:Antibiotic biosynthesis monooxygenase n=1 Tax=Acinetobacter cumulans TaxID=2136182 RepID=A0A498D086_9GAMM|nr:MULTISPECIES: antibiotic biosynthesis monooxygenase [Acinetobacter]NWK72973.1 antibiotic biosynthesis monooxygenase [Acinetobacter sp. SwsAc6]QCO20324.1 antibiotic biosynthesis monooxygenase [Acinetobacter cumulans]RKG43399.1 antibiotic biosynthesis monooxygenase [Acinetobacter cumulans]RKG51290.1 antibiotic biosynthesis monooxygenase [Acinetobacter cumulans]RLL35123.1 antibiotic biosynthesis monooxygenase [Acinetobacter cumulans]